MPKLLICMCCDGGLRTLQRRVYGQSYCSHCFGRCTNSRNPKLTRRVRIINAAIRWLQRRKGYRRAGEYIIVTSTRSGENRFSAASKEATSDTE
jgi:hypothetical protein